MDLQEHQEELVKICSSLSIKSLYLFGSALEETFSDESDIDFIFSFEDALSVVDYTKNYFVFKERLENLLGRDVDLIAEHTISNPFFMESIAQRKRLVYEAGS
jgi:predicted nucleotidyltransferase